MAILYDIVFIRIPKTTEIRSLSIIQKHTMSQNSRDVNDSQINQKINKQRKTSTIYCFSVFFSEVKSRL